MQKCGCLDTISNQSVISDKGITYKVVRNQLIVRKGKCKDIITIYEECPFKLTRQFQIMNLYLNLPIMGFLQEGEKRNIPEGTNYTTKYESIENITDDCVFLSFKTLSPEPEGFRLSRAVMPRNELIQLYQTNLIYKIDYEIINKNKCGSMIEFLYADFSQDMQTSGASYPLINIKGKNVGPFKVCNYNKGSFYVNGWQYPLLVKLTGNAKVFLTITGIKSERYKMIGGIYPPIDLILPIQTKFGLIDVLVSQTLYNGVNYIRYVTDNFRGSNSIIRGYHQYNPNFPCFETTDVIIFPPPYQNDNILMSSVPGDIVNLSASNISENSRQNSISFFFNDQTINPVDSFIKLSNIFEQNQSSLFVNVNLTIPAIVRVTVHNMEITFNRPVSGDNTYFFLVAAAGFSNSVQTCDPENPVSFKSSNLSVNRDRLSISSFTFDYSLSSSNSVLQFNLTSSDLAEILPPIQQGSLSVSIEYLRYGNC